MASRAVWAGLETLRRPADILAKGSGALPRGLSGHGLPLHEAVVEPALAQELLAGAALHHHAHGDDQDQVRVGDRAEPVRHNELRLSVPAGAEAVQDHLLREGVESARGLVQDEDRRVAQERARHGYPLALATAERGVSHGVRPGDPGILTRHACNARGAPSPPQQGLGRQLLRLPLLQDVLPLAGEEAVRHVQVRTGCEALVSRHKVQVGRHGHALQVLGRGLRAAVAHVVEQRVLEERGLLRHVADGAAPAPDIEAAELAQTLHGDGAAGGVVEAHQEREDRALAAPRRPAEAHCDTGPELDLKRHRLQHLDVRTLHVPELDRVELDLRASHPVRLLGGRRARVDRRPGVDEVQHAGARLDLQWQVVEGAQEVGDGHQAQDDDHLGRHTVLKGRPSRDGPGRVPEGKGKHPELQGVCRGLDKPSPEHGEVVLKALLRSKLLELPYLLLLALHCTHGLQERDGVVEDLR
mmetsp:Transcript_103811/g.289138  ORF Transcript_103811/g.289138 Transcript_103811/m.289138 type:complete len:470 (+) Transcript_103811:81-1490(+)